VCASPVTPRLALLTLCWPRVIHALVRFHWHVGHEASTEESVATLGCLRRQEAGESLYHAENGTAAVLNEEFAAVQRQQEQARAQAHNLRTGLRNLVSSTAGGKHCACEAQEPMARHTGRAAGAARGPERTAASAAPETGGGAAAGHAGGRPSHDAGARGAATHVSTEDGACSAASCVAHPASRSPRAPRLVSFAAARLDAPQVRLVREGGVRAATCDRSVSCTSSDRSSAPYLLACECVGQAFS
jgi:hypothetical protein